MAIVERKFEFAGTRVELLSLLQGESDQRHADFLQQRPGLRARDVWLLSAQWRGRPVQSLDSIRFYPLSALHPVNVPHDVLALLREDKTVVLTLGGPPRGPVTVTAVCHHESFMPWFRDVLRLLGQEEEKSDEISVSAPSPAADAPLLPPYRNPGRKSSPWNQAAIDRLLCGDAVDDVRAEWRMSYAQGTGCAPGDMPDGEGKTWQKRVWKPYRRAAAGPK